MKECVKEKHQLFHCQDIQKEQVRKRLKENNDLSNDLGLENLEKFFLNFTLSRILLSRYLFNVAVISPQGAFCLFNYNLSVFVFLTGMF